MPKFNEKLEMLREMQLDIARKAIIEDRLPKKVKTVCGFDVAYSGEKAIAVGVVIAFKNMKIIEISKVEECIEFPYIPTFLSFREGPLIIKAYKKFKTKPDVVLVNGHGIAHPLHAGLATYVGVYLEMATVGVAQKKLVGEYESIKRGISRLFFRDKQVGWVVESKKGSKPIFVSPGHLISLDKSLQIVIKCLKGSKLPEPLRLAHNIAENTDSQSCALELKPI